MFEILIPTFSGEKLIQVERGSSVVFVGANGTGKTRLATHIENLLNVNACVGNGVFENREQWLKGVW